MKRVCIVRQKNYPAQKNLRRDAETLVREGYEVDVICVGRKGQKKRETMNGVNVHRIIMPYHRDKIFWYLFDYAAFFTLTSFKLAWFSLRKRYDVIEINTMPDFLVFITVFPRLLGCKVILYMFENMPGLFMSSFNKSSNHIAVRILRLIEKVSAHYAHRVIVSDGLPYKKVLESHGIPGKKITVVLNVPDDTIIHNTITPPEDKDHFRLIVASTLIKRCGIQTLIKAVPLLVKDIPELVVDIIGDGEYRKVLEQNVRDTKIENYVNFTGFIPYEDVIAKISRAHVGIAPTLSDVGAPNKIFEYFALRKPSIASVQPSLQAVFDGKCIMFFEPSNERELADRILELYHNPEKMASMAAHAFQLYNNCRWEVMKHEYLKVYKECLTDKHSNRPAKGVV